MVKIILQQLSLIMATIGTCLADSVIQAEIPTAVRALQHGYQSDCLPRTDE